MCSDFLLYVVIRRERHEGAHVATCQAGVTSVCVRSKNNDVHTQLQPLKRGFMSKTAFFQLKSWARFILPSRYVAPYHATPEPVVRRMLQLARVSATDTVYDIGCGDARLLIAAAKRGARGVGFELHGSLVQEARQEVEKAGVGHLVKVFQEDATKASLKEATVITLYLSDSGNTHVINNLKQQIQQQTRVVSFAFPIQGYLPDKTDKIHGIDIYLYNNIGLLPPVISSLTQ